MPSPRWRMSVPRASIARDACEDPCRWQAMRAARHRQEIGEFVARGEVRRRGISQTRENESSSATYTRARAKKHMAINNGHRAHLHARDLKLLTTQYLESGHEQQ